MCPNVRSPLMSFAQNVSQLPTSFHTRVKYNILPNSIPQFNTALIVCTLSGMDAVSLTEVSIDTAQLTEDDMADKS